MTNISTRLELWEERDRLHIALIDAATEQTTIIEWWDDDAREAIEDGFIKPGRQMHESVIRYAEDMQIMPQEPEEEDKDSYCMQCESSQCCCAVFTAEMISWYDNNGR